MAVIQIRMEEVGTIAAQVALGGRLEAMRPNAPIAVLVHGMRLPGANLRPCPQSHIFAPIDPSVDIVWPSRLGVAGREGLAIGFDWPARGGVRGVFRAAPAAGAALARLLTDLCRTAPGRRVTLIGHSMGAAVILAAVGALREPAAHVAILLAGAACRARALDATATAAGRAMRFLNVSAAENAPFDRILSVWLGVMTQGLLVDGLEAARPNWIDLRFGDEAARAALATLGHRVAGPERRVCHLSTYTRGGALELYAALIHGRLRPEVLAAAIPAPDRAATAGWDATMPPSPLGA
jgi:pimeloyl-ACP methyl ester carboxylesterase